LKPASGFGFRASANDSLTAAGAERCRAESNIVYRQSKVHASGADFGFAEARMPTPEAPRTATDNSAEMTPPNPTAPAPPQFWKKIQCAA